MAHDIEMARVNVKGGPPEDTEYKPVNWKKIFFTPKYIPWHIIGIGVAILTILMTIHHDEVVDKLRPLSEKLHDLPGGWIIPIVILFVISFPPLFGHEVIALLCGVVWGLWIGFAIVGAGTFLGEIGTWYAFMYTLRRRAEKLERTNLNYGALARLTRDGGFMIVLLIRLSAVPSHFSTAVFSTCNVKFWHFFVATLLSLPKQIFLVFLGVLLVQQNQSNIIQNVMFGIVFIISMALGVYIWVKMKKIKKTLLEEQNMRRERRLRDEMEAVDKEAAKRTTQHLSSPKPSWGLGQAQNQEQNPMVASMWNTHRGNEQPPIRPDWPLMSQPPPTPDGRPF
ncbi:hypothetical protein P280DRAFT_192692 [Massarina eburnea CBS 473.64]|uniref:Golgi apparatus membrane protein TVP38 n=1 Tax=Massarina eburnea CBS 473.64 TaxID=1395130 RepID=A0A6A6RK34_9PLEO|nr:hypothetical protein P280DRAFT_192692 [Massarina eburnea CBS 473.64]